MPGLKTVIEMTQESVEDVMQCGGVPVTVCSAPGRTGLRPGPVARSPTAQTKAHRRKPVVLHMPVVIQVLRPDALVTGAEPTAVYVTGHEISRFDAATRGTAAFDSTRVTRIVERSTRILAEELLHSRALQQRCSVVAIWNIHN